MIHHLSTEQRRLEAIQELVRITRRGGLILVYVWALEQDSEEKEAVFGGVEESKISNPSDNRMENLNLNDRESSENGQSKSSNENDKQYIQVAEGRNSFQQQDLLVPWHLKNSNNKDPYQEEHVFHRFYHVFKQGELETLCRKIPNVKVRDLYLDCGNWCIILEKV